MKKTFIVLLSCVILVGCNNCNNINTGDIGLGWAEESILIDYDWEGTFRWFAERGLSSCLGLGFERSNMRN